MKIKFIPMPAGVFRMKPVYVQGLPPGPGPEAIASAVRDIVLKATDNLAWLREGETVLIKPFHKNELLEAVDRAIVLKTGSVIFDGRSSELAQHEDLWRWF